MNEVLATIRNRHAIRRFSQKQVEENVLDQILEAALYAPSAGNNQHSRIVVCQDRELNEKLGRINRWMQFKGNDPKTVAHSVSADQPSIQDDFNLKSGYYNAPTVLTIFVKKHKYKFEDAAMIGNTIWLAANSLGVSACYVGRTDEVFSTELGQKLCKLWEIPGDMEAICNILLGYLEGPAPQKKSRKQGRILRV